MTPAPNNAFPIFTPAEIEKMRLVVADHDNRTRPTTFDLNNPPRQAYSHQEFPQLVYGTDADGKAISKRVMDADDRAAALKSNWFLTPQAEPDYDEPELDAAAQAEIASITKRAAEARKKAKAKAAK